MPVQQSEIDALNEAIASGERLVRFADRTIEYRSVDELIRARDDRLRQMQSEQDTAAGVTRPRQIRIYHGGRGY